jgi:hypothetical protein
MAGPGRHPPGRISFYSHSSPRRDRSGIAGAATATGDRFSVERLAPAVEVKSMPQTAGALVNVSERTGRPKKVTLQAS